MGPRSLFFLIFLVLISSYNEVHASQLEAQVLSDLSLENIDQVKRLLKQDKKEQPPFSLQFGFNQINGMITGADLLSRLSLSLSYAFKWSWSLYFKQSMDKHYYLNPNSDKLNCFRVNGWGNKKKMRCVYVERMIS